MGLRGYSLPNTIPTPSDTDSWPGLRVQPRLVDTRRPKALDAEATCCPWLWGVWNSPSLPRLSHSLRVLLALLPWDTCLSFPQILQTPAPRAQRPPEPGGAPLLGPQVHHGLSHGVALLAQRPFSRERVGEPAKACSCGLREQGSSVATEEPQKCPGEGHPWTASCTETTARDTWPPSQGGHIQLKSQLCH